MRYIICALFAAAIYPLFYRSLHIFQLCSYQFPSYGKYLKEHLSETFGVVRLIPAAVGFAGCLVGGWVGVGICAAAAGISMLICWEKTAKKPLVFTARAKRLTAFHMVFSALLMLAGTFIFPAPFWAVLFILQPYLLMLSALICSPMERAISAGYVNDARNILKQMPSLTVIGITGSYGKTSTKEFLTSLLSASRQVCATPGNFNTTLGVTRTVREKLSPLDEIFVCEMGARHVGDIKEICDLVEPEYGIITAVAPQHLETFGSMEAIRNTKLELYDAVKNKGGAFVCWDSEPLREWGEHENVTFYGTSGPGYVASDISAGRNGLKFTVTAPDGESCRYETRLLGRANVLNITAAVAVCHRLGMSLESLAPRVRSFPQVAHRLQLIPGRGMNVIDDAYNANPAGCEMALDALADFEGLRIVVTPGMVELGEREAELNRRMGEYAAGKCDIAVLVDRKRAVPIREGLLSAGFSEQKLFVVDTLEEGMQKIRAIPGEKTVLLLNDLPDQY